MNREPDVYCERVLQDDVAVAYLRGELPRGGAGSVRGALFRMRRLLRAAAGACGQLPAVLRQEGRGRARLPRRGSAAAASCGLGGAGSPSWRGGRLRARGTGRRTRWPGKSPSSVASPSPARRPRPALPGNAGTAAAGRPGPSRTAALRAAGRARRRSRRTVAFAAGHGALRPRRLRGRGLRPARGGPGRSRRIGGGALLPGRERAAGRPARAGDPASWSAWPADADRASPRPRGTTSRRRSWPGVTSPRPGASSQRRRPRVTAITRNSAEQLLRDLGTEP